MNRKKLILLVPVLLILGLALYYFMPGRSLPRDVKIDYIMVDKTARKMKVYADGKRLKTYRISLGRNPVGDKEFQGDYKTPEGVYSINTKNPNSRYHKNLGISYPDSDDVAVARKLGKPAGGDIKIHGLKPGLGYIGKFHLWLDWTQGCIAVTNPEIDELYDRVATGTKIEIKP